MVRLRPLVTMPCCCDKLTIVLFWGGVLVRFGCAEDASNNYLMPVYMVLDYAEYDMLGLLGHPDVHVTPVCIGLPRVVVCKC